MKSPGHPDDSVLPPLVLSAERQRRLALDLRARLQQDAIDTHAPLGDDPHVLLLATVGALADQLGSIEVVLVDGFPWTRNDDLASADAADTVYAFDDASGALRFGDGVHGCRPADGARIVSVFRYRAGGAGNLPGDAGGASITPLRRPRYFAGQLLGAEDFAMEQEYHRAKQRLLNRHLHGWGVVDGLDVEVAGHDVVVSSGLAIDPAGREIVVDHEVLVPLAKLRKPTALSVRYVERETDPVPSPDGDGGSEYTRVVEGYEFAFDSQDPARVPLALLVRRGGRWRLDRKFRRRRVR